MERVGMGGRNRIPYNAFQHQEVPLGMPHTRSVIIEDPRVSHHIPTSAAIASSHPILAESHVAARRREIQSLLFDNQRLAATHVALKQELSAAQQELQRLSSVASSVKAERDTEVRDVYEMSLKMEVEVRSIDALAVQLAQVRKDIQKLTAAKQELSGELKMIDGDLARSRTEAEELPQIQKEIETMRREIQRGRTAIEYEKKTRGMNLEESQKMEKNMFSMAREIEKLHGELANAEKRARAALAAASAASDPSLGYGTSYENGKLGYGGNPYFSQSSTHQFI